MFESLISDPFVQTLLLLFLIALNAAFLVSFFVLRQRINRFVKGKNGQNLEAVINESSADIAKLSAGFKNISGELENQEKMMIAAVKKIGIVRFNPFNNTGGDQSFAIAMMNSKNSGVVISSLYLREGTRVYAKPIENLKSTYPLSKEEEAAIRKATENQ